MEAVTGKPMEGPPPVNTMALAKPGVFEAMMLEAGLEVESVVESSYPFAIGKESSF